MKLALIPEWKRAWKFASVQFSVLGLFLMSVSDIVQEVWKQIPPEYQVQIPHSVTIAKVVFILSIIGRLFVILQKDKQNADAQ